MDDRPHVERGFDEPYSTTVDALGFGFILEHRREASAGGAALIHQVPERMITSLIYHVGVHRQ